VRGLDRHDPLQHCNESCGKPLFRSLIVGRVVRSVSSAVAKVMSNASITGERAEQDGFLLRARIEELRCALIEI
jgi:hypothetical protein